MEDSGRASYGRAGCVVMTHYAIALTYKPKIEGVRRGDITQTIRPEGKRDYKVGDALTIHGWAGRPYFSEWSWRLERQPLLEVIRIKVDKEGLTMPTSTLRGPELKETFEDHTFPWDHQTVDFIAELDGIKPPTGVELRNVLLSKNKGRGGRYRILRWKYVKREDSSENKGV